MKPLFSSEGFAFLEATMAKRPVLAFDFDGTLAPIVAKPEQARVPPDVAERLGRLARHLTVAIVSGRRIADVRDRLFFEPQHIIGNHGAENPLATTQASPGVLDGMRERLRDNAAALDAAGVFVEDKQHSLALHYRLAPDPERAGTLVAGLVDRLDPGVDAYGGKMVMNVVSTDAPDKAQAVASVVAHAKAAAAVFLGDDVNDEPVFARDEPAWLTVKVGNDHTASRAKFWIDSPADVTRLLDRMLDLLGDRVRPEA